MKGKGLRLGALASAALVACAALSLAPGGAAAKSGTLDPSFGEGGRVVMQTSLGGPTWLEAHVDVAEGPDDTIVVAAGKTVFRFLPDGSLDPSFADGGELTVADPEGLPFTLHDLVLDPEGRIYLLGEVEIPGIRLLASYDGRTIPLTQGAIVRYDPSGALDRSFGGGGGAVVTDFGQPAYYRGPVPPPGESLDPRYTKAVTGIAGGSIDGEGDLTVLGRITTIEGCIRAAANSTRRLVARFTPAGDLDPSFGGGDGIVSDTGFYDIWGLAAIPGGGEMLAGPSIARSQCEGSPPGEAPVPELVARLAPDGSVDASFATNGFRSIPLTGPVAAMAVDARGRFDLMAGSTVLRLTRTGALDRRFGDEGARSISATHVELGALLPIGRGGLVLAGTHLVSGPPATGPTELLPQSFVVTRRAASGRPDRGFGHDGWVTTRFGDHSSARAEEAFIDAEGRLVVAGPVVRPDLAPTGGIALARYRLGF